MKRMSPNERLKFYENNPSVKKELLDWFKIDGNCLRCMAMRPEDRKYKYVYRNIKSQYAYALTPLTEELFNNSITFARTIEFLPWLFDTEISKCMSKMDVDSYIKGITFVIDIDAPDINENKKNLGRFDLLDESRKYIEKMDNVINTFKDELTKVDLWEGIRLTFTGNGINIVFPLYIDKYEELLKYVYGLIGVIKDVSKITDYPFVHYKKPGWNSNFKPPGTFHFDNNRLTLEIPDKNNKLDLEWLIEHSNPYNKRLYKHGI